MLIITWKSSFGNKHLLFGTGGRELFQVVLLQHCSPRRSKLGRNSDMCTGTSHIMVSQWYVYPLQYACQWNVYPLPPPLQTSVGFSSVVFLFLNFLNPFKKNYQSAVCILTWPNESDLINSVENTSKMGNFSAFYIICFIWIL